MILQSLSSYYDRVAEAADTSIPTDGFSSEKIHFALVLNKSGNLEQILDLRETKGARKIPRSLVVRTRPVNPSSPLID
jgi:CRISPR-associated protein Csd1